eukprot:TRINITY_DN729_c0_g1_i1.p1 TRINITY_DN729_c0_g1~~TRINITY_DN729_c0_g1_i1.p1  ORF type:complete len:302 (+),score=48.96 TRINITY_DN729_c0_g1_i1:48-953(+)
MSCGCAGPVSGSAGAMPMYAAAPPPPPAADFGGMSAEAYKHQHVVNHLACREAACPQGVSPHQLAVWGARRDVMERVPCEEPMPACEQQMGTSNCDPCSALGAPPTMMMNPMMRGGGCGGCGGGGGAVPCGSGWIAPMQTSNTTTMVDWGGRFSASPEYDAKGSPHGFYGPPQIASIMNNPHAAMANNNCCGQVCGVRGGGFGGVGGYIPNHFGNAYPGQRNNMTKPDTTNDDYYQQREMELRTGRTIEPGRIPVAQPVTTTTTTYVPSSPPRRVSRRRSRRTTETQPRPLSTRRRTHSRR